jgi:hypothetical protein
LPAPIRGGLGFEMNRMNREREGLSFDGHSRAFIRTQKHRFRLNDGAILNHTRMGGGGKWLAFSPLSTCRSIIVT